MNIYIVHMDTYKQNTQRERLEPYTVTQRLLTTLHLPKAQAKP